MYRKSFRPTICSILCIVACTAAMGNTFHKVPGPLLAQIAVAGNNLVWGLDFSGLIYQYNPSTQKFEQISGRRAQVAVGASGNVWGIAGDQTIWRFDPTKGFFVRVAGFLTSLSLDTIGDVWGVNGKCIQPGHAEI